MPDQAPEVVVECLSPQQIELLRRCKRQIRPSAERIHAKPLRRYGKTSAELLVVNFHEEGRTKGMPLVVKIDDIGEIRKENEAIKRLEIYFEDALARYDQIIEYEALGRRRSRGHHPQGHRKGERGGYGGDPAMP